MSEPDQNVASSSEISGANSAKTSKVAVASLILGGLSLIFSCLAGLPGFILGFIALEQIKKSGGLLKGSGLAVTGLILSGVLSFVSLVIAILIGMLLPALEQAREAAERVDETRRIQQIGEAVHQEQDQPKQVELKGQNKGPEKLHQETANKNKGEKSKPQ